MKPYNDYSSYLKNKYGSRVYKIGLDAGLSCPNRDGTKGVGGCTYCNDDGSRSGYTNPADDVKRQITARIEYLKRARKATKFIAYFQAFTNTYAEAGKLKKIYDQVLGFGEIVGISIGTRPDTVDLDKAALIASYRTRYEVWIELGLQSIHNETLKKINRGHTFEDFLKALNLAKKFGIPVCVHVILGLPGETRDDMLETAKTISALGVDGVKIHLLHILKGSSMEKQYSRGEIPLLSQSEYIELASDFLENLSPDILIHRLTGEGAGLNHIAPAWAADAKTDTISGIRETLERRGTRQGCRYK